ncbi:MAG TPA: prepilin peptidase [Xanthobacteraceae bacterium]|nr:prepilin peptidase [Xanthobacteraceae bacterium]
MSDAALGSVGTVGRVAPRRAVRRERSDADSFLTWVAARFSIAMAGWRSRRAMQDGLAAASRMQDLAGLSDDELARRRVDVRLALRTKGLSRGNVVEGLAIAGEVARRILKLTPFTEQLACASALLAGAVAEMETGEGKTLAAYLAASVFALAGRIVHVVTANDYLANRDARELEPAYAALGLGTGVIVGGDPGPSRLSAYGRDVVYVSSKEVVFDFLRDGLIRTFHPANPTLALKIGRALGIARDGAALPLQRGLDVAIVDEIDSVLIDEAVTPLLISTNRAGDITDDVARQALDLAADFRPGIDFVIDPFDYMPTMTKHGIDRLENEVSALPGPWRIRLIREELIRSAISARHVLKRDRHYLVRDDKIVLIDQQSGRVTPDRHWGHGLSLMVEMKEGCASTGEKKSIASISFQRYFRGYAFVCGMSGTVREVASEMYAVYGLKATRIPRRLPLRRTTDAPRTFESRDQLWTAAADIAKELQARGQPALVAVRSVAEADRASAALAAVGVAHRVLSAAQDSAEAEIVAHAGVRGTITVVTNMAGRGTDIRLGPGVAELGGLVVMICERHDSRRVDRQLIGRCARQGDPGRVIELISREDGVLACLHPRWGDVLNLRPAWTRLAISRAQHLSDTRGLRARLQLLRRDQQLAKVMAFAGGLD